jgi:hypothetical protein
VVTLRGGGAADAEVLPTTGLAYGGGGSGGSGSPVDFAGFGNLGLACLASADSYTVTFAPLHGTHTRKKPGPVFSVTIPAPVTSIITMCLLSIFPNPYSAHTMASDSWAAPAFLEEGILPGDTLQK